MNNLPDFFVLGVMRAGTSTMFALLSQHPQIKPPKEKEIHYYNKPIDSRDIKWYKDFFPKTNDGELTFDGTGHYFMWDYIPERITKDVGQSRFIVLLRDPAERAWSEFWLTKDDRGKELKDLMREDEICVQRGLYAKHLNNWYIFADQPDFLIIESETFFDEPQFTMDTVFEWLDLPAYTITEKVVDPFVWRKVKYGYPALSQYPEIEKWLRDFYSEPNKDLVKLFDGIGEAWKKEK